MDHLQLTMMVMATTDTLRGPHDAHGRRREFTAAELDALADFGWHWPDLKGAIAACVRVVRTRWRPRASDRLDQAPLPAAATTSRR